MQSKFYHCPECGVANTRNGDDEYWHMDSEGDGTAGPFKSVEEAKADALKYCENSRYGNMTIKIVKVVAESSTQVSFATTWNDVGLPDQKS